MKVENTNVESHNVAGLVKGSDPALAEEYVVLTAHLDHVGVGAPINGDEIYNGAMDNASGIATLLEIARTIVEAEPKRSVALVAVTGEEKGLLGSRYYSLNPTVPKGGIVANVNMDMFLPLYPLKSLMVLGLDESDLGDEVRAVAQEMGIGVQPDPQPRIGACHRADRARDDRRRHRRIGDDRQPAAACVPQVAGRALDGDHRRGRDSRHQ